MIAKYSRSLLSLCLAVSISLPSTGFANSLALPDIGTVAGATLTIDQENRYGDAYMRMLRASQPVINDPVINDYLNHLGHRLVANANDVKTPFTFFLIQDPNINAFAFFGGYIALHSGLFLHAQTESELASVMAHEIAHVTQRHLARSMEDQARRSPATLAALAGSLLLAIAAPQAGIAAITATTAGNLQGQINYTRSNEKEADRIGIATLAKAGFDTQAMPRFFGRLADEYRYASQLPPMLLTHPLPEDRITDSRERAQHYPKNPLSPSLNYQLTRARIIARHAKLETSAALSWFEHNKKQNNTVLTKAATYGEALIYLDEHDYPKARSRLESLLEQENNNLFYLDAMTDLYLASKQAEQAEQLLKKALVEQPNNAVLLINYANVLIEQKKYSEALRLLQRYTHNHPNDTNAWHLLSKASFHLQDHAEEQAALGELFALNANWNKAIQAYTQASQLAPLGSLSQARYDARIDQLLIERERFLQLK